MGAERGSARRRGPGGGHRTESGQHCEVREAAGKGRGLFATRDFRPGECVLSEAPLVCGPRNRLPAWGVVAGLAVVGWYNAASDWSLLNWAFRIAALLIAQRVILVTFEALYIWHCVRELPAPERQKYFNLRSGLPGYVPVLTESRIYRFNAVSDDTAGCVCTTVSMLNHSCLPNACFSWNPSKKHQEVQAMRPISRGEEIAVSYIDLWQTTDARRRSLRRALSFDCCCQRCSAPEEERRRSDERRMRCRELERRIPGHLQRGQVPEALQDLRTLRDTAQEELGTSESVILQEMQRSIAELEDAVAKGQAEAKASKGKQKTEGGRGKAEASAGKGVAS